LSDVPATLFLRQFCLYDNHVLRPVQAKRFVHQFRHAAIQTPEVPHPAHIARRKAGHIRILFFQELRSSHCRALFRAGADDSSDLAVQLHLRQLHFHDRSQCGKHCAVVNSLSDIHSFSFPAHSAWFNAQSREKHGNAAVFFSALTFFK